MRDPIKDGNYLWEMGNGEQVPVLIRNGYLHEPRHDGIPLWELEDMGELRLTKLIPEGENDEDDTSNSAVLDLGYEGRLRPGGKAYRD